MQVEIWSDVVCPWCYLGKKHFESALASFAHGDEVDVVFRSFELDPGAPTDVTTSTVELLASKYGMTPTQAQDAQRSMEQRAAGLGLTFRMDALRSGNTRTAHRLLHLARERGVQTALVERLHRAYFTEQGSIFDAAALVDHAVEVGLERDEAAAVVAGDRYDDAVAHDEALARSFGATGVPFFVIDRRYAISGAQPAEAILAVLQRAHADAQSADSEQVTA